jgi:hypothetical protein
MAAQDTRANGVERPHPHADGDRSEQPPDALLHLPGRLVREGDSENVVGRDAVLVDEIADPRGQYPGLSRAGSRENENRTFEVFCSLELFWVESLQVNA